MAGVHAAVREGAFGLRKRCTQAQHHSSMPKPTSGEAFKAFATLERCMADVEMQLAPAGQTIADRFRLEHDGEMLRPSMALTKVWFLHEMMHWAVEDEHRDKRARPCYDDDRPRDNEDQEWDDEERLLMLTRAPIRQLVALTDAAARLGEDPIEQAPYQAWSKLLGADDSNEARSVFDKEMKLPQSLPQAVGTSQTAIGTVLDRMLGEQVPSGN